MNDNNIIVKVYEFDKPLIQKIDSLMDNCNRDCHNKYFHTFDHQCEYALNFTTITNNETVIFRFSDKSRVSNELNKKLTIARERGFIFIRINNFEISF